MKSLVKTAEQVLVIDEAHKDNIASTLEGGGNGERGILVTLDKKWFHNKIGYTLIAGLNIEQGFVKRSVGIYPRQKVSDEGGGSQYCGY